MGKNGVKEKDAGAALNASERQAVLWSYIFSPGKEETYCGTEAQDSQDDRSARIGSALTEFLGNYREITRKP